MHIPITILAMAASTHAWTLWGGATGVATGGIGGALGNGAHSTFILTDNTQSNVCKGQEQGGFKADNNFCQSAIKCNNGNYVVLDDGPCKGTAQTSNGSPYSSIYKSDKDGNKGDSPGQCTWQYKEHTGGCAEGAAFVVVDVMVECGSIDYC